MEQSPVVRFGAETAMQRKDLPNLVQRAKRGDAEAFGDLVERLQHAVYGVAYATLGNRDDAEDACQEILFQAWRDLGSLVEPASFIGWLYGITRNRCRDLLRRRGREARSEQLTGDAQPELARLDPAARLERGEMRETVLAAIRALSQPNRLATVLFYIDGYSIQEVAEFLQVPPGTVKRRLHDSRKQLKEIIMDTVGEHLRREGPSRRLKREIMKRIGHWGRFRGDDPERLKMVEADPEWLCLMEVELALEPISAEAGAIRKQIASLEPCHESYVENVAALLEMIGTMKPGAVLDCGQGSDRRRQQARAHLQALETWQAEPAPPGDAGQPAREVFRLLGERTEGKLGPVRHLIGKLRDNGYSVYPDDEEDFDRVESRIQHLEICNYNWEENLRIVLQEIAAGKRLLDWHAPEGYNAHGDCPDRVSVLRETIEAAAQWAEGRPDGAGRWAWILGESTPEKRWLVASLCKHVRAQHSKFDTGALLPQPAL